MGIKNLIFLKFFAILLIVRGGKVIHHRRELIEQKVKILETTDILKGAKPSQLPKGILLKQLKGNTEGKGFVLSEATILNDDSIRGIKPEITIRPEENVTINSFAIEIEENRRMTK